MTESGRTKIVETQRVIRAETEADFPHIKHINNSAFGRDNEARLVEALRQTDAFIPALSIIAQSQDDVIGHILFYPI